MVKGSLIMSWHPGRLKADRRACGTDEAFRSRFDGVRPDGDR
jgi:hypothetical protein